MRAHAHLATATPAKRRALLAGAAQSPLPATCIPPMLATLGSMPAQLAAFGYEVKWDGYRALARWDGADLLLCSRNGVDLTGRFHELAPLRTALRRPVLLDGEIVAMDRHGSPSFSALQTRMPRPGPGHRSGRTWDGQHFSLHYMIFDILHYDGHSTCALPYTRRRALLESLALAGPAWRVPPMHPDGPALLEVMRRTRQEGIIAKRLTSTYSPGRRSPDWIKVKLNRSDEFLIAGFWSSGKHRLSSLLLACYPTAADARAGRNLRYCGKVGTGFAEADRAQLEQALVKLRVDHPLATGALPGAAGITWCKPKLIAQIHFTEWTHDGALRHPSFLGLRSDKRPAGIVHAPDTE